MGLSTTIFKQSSPSHRACRCPLHTLLTHHQPPLHYSYYYHY